MLSMSVANGGISFRRLGPAKDTPHVRDVSSQHVTFMTLKETDDGYTEVCD